MPVAFEVPFQFQVIMDCREDYRLERGLVVLVIPSGTIGPYFTDIPLSSQVVIDAAGEERVDGEVFPILVYLGDPAAYQVLHLGIVPCSPVGVIGCLFIFDLVTGAVHFERLIEQGAHVAPFRGRVEHLLGLEAVSGKLVLPSYSTGNDVHLVEYSTHWFLPYTSTVTSRITLRYVVL